MTKYQEKAITWGFHCRQLREKRLKKEEAFSGLLKFCRSL